jgi:hypothetical protein
LCEKEEFQKQKGRWTSMNGQASSLAETDHEHHLRDLLEKHTIRYEVYFEQGILDDARIASIGFEIDLLASHDHGVTSFTPGCHLCVSTFDDLCEIARWIMPKGQRDSEYTIEPFDRGLHMDPAHRLRPEVRLAIKIEHKRKKKRPLDDCEWPCLSDMEAGLRNLGVQKSRGPGRG